LHARAGNGRWGKASGKAGRESEREREKETERKKERERERECMAAGEIDRQNR
jgi:hypothetical protein